MSDLLIYFLVTHALLSFVGAVLLTFIIEFAVHPWKEMTWAELVVIVLLGPGFAALYSILALMSVLVAGGLWLFECLDKPILKDKR